MSFDRKSLLLYAVTDRAWLGGQTLYQQVEQALLGGATLVQLREKELDGGSFLAEALELKGLCRRFGVPLVINDSVDIALRSGADGVHVGQSDMEAGGVRRLIGEGRILGVSAQTVEQAVLAEQRGADYIGVGAVFPTGSKADAAEVGLQTLKEICRAVSIPVVAIGGIGKRNVSQLAGSGVSGVAVISALFAAGDIRAAAFELRALAQSIISD